MKNKKNEFSYIRKNKKTLSLNQFQNRKNKQDDSGLCSNENKSYKTEFESIILFIKNPMFQFFIQYMNN